jgi:chaperonin GroES
MKKKAKNTKKKSVTVPQAKIPTNTSGIRPLQDRVVIKPLSPEDMGHTSASGIIIPETIDKEKPEQGTVVAVGPGKRGDDNVLIPVGVSVGQRVMFSKYGYDEVKVKGVEYYIVSESNILAILN